MFLDSPAVPAVESFELPATPAPSFKSLFTVGKANPKVGKGATEAGYLVAVLHLAPHDAGVAGKTVCASASPGCIAACLNTAGRGGIMKKGETTNGIQEARKARTLLYWNDRPAFLALVRKHLAKLERQAAKQGRKLAVRMNGTSDLPGLAMALATEFPGVQFYDYTAHPKAELRTRENYHITFSRKENNAANVLAAIKAGTNVAVVFSTKRGRELPATYLGRPVIDGDETDLRFLDDKSTDGKGLIVGLRAKGKARKDCGGFVVAV